MIVDNHLSHIFMVSSLSAIGMAIIGIVSYTVLEKSVPEFIEALGTGGSSEDYGSFDDSDHSHNQDSSASIDGEDFEGHSDSEESTGSGPVTPDGNFGDHIVVDNVPIKNDPQLMAEAVRTMMSKDDDS